MSRAAVARRFLFDERGNTMADYLSFIVLQVSPVIHFISAVLPVESKINGERRESTSYIPI